MRGTPSLWPVVGLGAVLVMAAAGLALPLPTPDLAAVLAVQPLTTDTSGVAVGDQERLATMFLLLFVTSLLGLYVASRHLKRRGAGFSADVLGGNAPKPERIPELEDGESYLVTQGQSRALKVFTQELEKGTPGLAVSRTHPDKLKGSWDLKGAKVHWLTDAQATERGAVKSLEDLDHQVRKFLDSGKKSAVLLDGLEYLFVQYNFNDVMKLLEGLRDAIMATGSKLLIPIDLLALVKRQRALLTREFRQL